MTVSTSADFSHVLSLFGTDRSREALAASPPPSPNWATLMMAPHAATSSTVLAEVQQLSTFIQSHPGVPLVAVREGLLLPRRVMQGLTKDPDKCIVVVRPRTTPAEHAEVVRLSGKVVIGAGSSVGPLRATDSAFHGAISVPPAMQSAIQVIVDGDPQISLPGLIHRLSSWFLVSSISIDGPEHRVGGGSFATCGLTSRFKKHASGLGRLKLIDEINFIGRLPPELACFYPKILSHRVGDNLAEMEQEFITWPSLREHLLYSDSDAADGIRRMRHVLFELTELAYERDTTAAPPNYVDELHYQRVWKRQELTQRLSPLFQPLIAAEKIVLNGREYLNTRPLLEWISSFDPATAMVTPPRVTPHAHGDLHFENILVDPRSTRFRLVDPRGYKLCDLFYDLGKLSHSTNGLYDLLHEDVFGLEIASGPREIVAQISFPDAHLVALYAEINEALRRCCFEITNDPLAVVRMLFNEAMHFCADMPFHLVGDGKERKAVAIYLTGVRLLNEFVELFLCNGKSGPRHRTGH